MVVDVHSEVLGHLMVHSFHLGICLRVVCHGEVLLDVKDLTDVMSKLTHELGASVQHNLLGDPEEREDLLFVNVGELRRHQGDRGGYHNCYGTASCLISSHC